MEDKFNNILNDDSYKVYHSRLICFNQVNYKQRNSM